MEIARVPGAPCDYKENKTSASEKLGMDVLNLDGHQKYHATHQSVWLASGILIKTKSKKNRAPQLSQVQV